MTTAIKIKPVSDDRPERRRTATRVIATNVRPRTWLVKRARAHLAAGVYDSQECLLAAVEGLLSDMERISRRTGRAVKRDGRPVSAVVARRGEDRRVTAAVPAVRRGR